MIRKIVFSAVVLVAIGFLVYWQQGGQNEAAKTGEVHFAPTHQKVVDEMLAMARVGPEDVIYDLGCGDGRIVITAAHRHRSQTGPAQPKERRQGEGGKPRVLLRGGPVRHRPE